MGASNFNFLNPTRQVSTFGQPGYISGLNPMFQNLSVNGLDFVNQTGSYPANLGLPVSYDSIGSIGSNTSNYASRQGFPSAIAYGNTTSTPSGFGSGFFDPKNTGFGFNANTVGLGLAGLNSLTNLYTGLQGLKLAKDQFNFGKASALRNERNTVNDYNLNLENRIGRERALTGMSEEDAAAKLAKYRAVAG